MTGATLRRTGTPTRHYYFRVTFLTQRHNPGTCQGVKRLEPLNSTSEPPGVIITVNYGCKRQRQAFPQRPLLWPFQSSLKTSTDRSKGDMFGPLDILGCNDSRRERNHRAKEAGILLEGLDWGYFGPLQLPYFLCNATLEDYAPAL
jgi:hypothetical protein